MDYYLRDNCRLCESKKIVKLFSLNSTPPANAFVDEENIEQACYPLDLFLCDDCFHVQLNTVVNPEVLFKDYLDFLDEVRLYIRGRELFCKEYKFARQINIFNESIVDGLFNLRITYCNCNLICSKIGAFIMYLYDFRDEVKYFTRRPRRSHSF